MSQREQFFAIHDRLLEAADPEIAAAIEAERRRQNEGLELIASENFVSPAVMAAMGSVMTNKYAEGYPGKRYYGGCQFVDIAEELARERAKSFSAPSTQTSNPTRAPRPTCPSILRCLNPATPCSGWISPTAAT